MSNKKVIAGQKMQCGRCGQIWFVYYDIQTKGSMCPKCNQVQGVLFDEEGVRGGADHLYSIGDCPQHLDGENDYDWDWLEYDKPKRAGADA